MFKYSINFIFVVDYEEEEEEEKEKKKEDLEYVNKFNVLLIETKVRETGYFTSYITNRDKNSLFTLGIESNRGGKWRILQS